MVAIVLLPGMDGTGALFADFVSALGQDFLPIVISYPEDQELDYPALEELVRARLPFDQPYFLLGESFSGPIAISIAASRPVGLMGLILSCSFVRNPIPAFRPLKRTLNFLPIKSKLMEFVFSLLLAGTSSPGIRQAMRKALARVSARTLRTRLRTILETDYSNKLQEIQAPILYLKAAHDHVVPSSAIKHIVRLLPSVQVVAFKGPHLLLQALPGEVATIVKNFAVQVMSIRNGSISKSA
ncbi:MAG TPA: alpha/beta fold hydrolase [Burkholderiaceae bacterium]|jgi:pimeloyl-ACP methyl ester carboxylesterase